LKTVLHLAPHPDDELIGAPATLMALRDAGHRIVNVACSLGRPQQRARREAELREACRRARFEIRVPDEPISLSWGDDLVAAQEKLTRLILEAIAEEEPTIIASPHPHDRHHAHEVVGRAARDALTRCAAASPRWWMWSIWGDLPLPTIATSFDAARLDEILAALDAYVGELERNDYRRLVRGRGEMNASLGPERVFGFGSSASDADYAELVTEVALVDARWLLGSAGWLDPREPLRAPSETDVGDWLYAESVTERFGPPGEARRKEKV
jgi:LmbE family N-acetylglucosaminyl deacetylase